MSEIKDFRDQVAARIVAQLEEVTAEEVIVSRRGDIFTQIQSAVAKSAKGLAITIGPARGRNNSEDNLDLTFTVTYEIRLWFLPLYHPVTGDDMEAHEEELRDDVIKALAGRWLEGSLCHERVTVPDFGPANDTEANVTFITIRREHDLED